MEGSLLLVWLGLSHSSYTVREGSCVRKPARFRIELTGAGRKLSSVRETRHFGCRLRLPCASALARIFLFATKGTAAAQVLYLF